MPKPSTGTALLYEAIARKRVEPRPCYSLSGLGERPEPPRAKRPRACIFTGDRLPGPHARTERSFLHVITPSQRSRLYMAGIPHEEGRPIKKVPCLPWVSGQSRRRLCGYPAMIRPRGCPKMPTWPGYKGNAPARGRGPRGVNGRRAAIITASCFAFFSCTVFQ